MSPLRAKGPFALIALILVFLAPSAGCGSDSPPPESEASADPVNRPQVCWGPDAIATGLGEPAGSVYAPWRRRSIAPGWIGDGKLRYYIRGSVMLNLEHDWREILRGGGDGAEEVVAAGREAAAQLVANPSLLRRPATLRETFAEAQAMATEFGFSFCTLDD